MTFPRYRRIMIGGIPVLAPVELDAPDEFALVPRPPVVRRRRRPTGPNVQGAAAVTDLPGGDCRAPTCEPGGHPPPARAVGLRPGDEDPWAEVGGEHLAAARVVIESQLEVDAHDAVPFRIPVIEPDTRMLDLQREWHRSVFLRALIRVAGERTEEEVAVSQVVRGLWEMSRSRAWIDGGGKFPFVADFRLLC